MKNLLAIIGIAMACICLNAATPSYENFDPAYFTRSGNTLRVNFTNISGPTNGITATVATNIAAYQSQIATNNLVRTNDSRSLLFTNIILGATNGGLLGVINPIIEYINPANGKIIFGLRSGNSLSWISGDSSLVQFNQNDVTFGTNVILSGQTINSWDDVTNYFALPSGGGSSISNTVARQEYFYTNTANLFRSNQFTFSGGGMNGQTGYAPGASYGNNEYIIDFTTSVQGNPEFFTATNLFHHISLFATNQLATGHTPAGISQSGALQTAGYAYHSDFYLIELAFIHFRKTEHPFIFTNFQANLSNALNYVQRSNNIPSSFGTNANLYDGWGLVEIGYNSYSAAHYKRCCDLMAIMAMKAGQPLVASNYYWQAQTIRSSMTNLWDETRGLLRTCSQGTTMKNTHSLAANALAVLYDAADDRIKNRIEEEFVKYSGHNNGFFQYGALRTTPIGECLDAAIDSDCDGTDGSGTYQTGGYWPLTWGVEVVARRNPDLAEAMMKDMYSFGSQSNQFYEWWNVSADLGITAINKGSSNYVNSAGIPATYLLTGKLTDNERLLLRQAGDNAVRPNLGLVAGSNITLSPGATGLSISSSGTGSGTFDYSALTNKPAPILLLTTNQGSSLSNAFAIAAGDSSVTLVTNANGRLVTITATGSGTNGGGAAVVSNSVVTWTTGSWFTNSTAYYLVVNAPVILTTDNAGGNSGQMNFNVDTNLDGTADWFLRSSVAVDSATTVLSTDIRYLGGIVPPNSAFQYQDVSINGTATMDGPTELTFLSTGSSGSGSGTFDYALLTNKPAPILLVATNQGSSLTNTVDLIAGDSSITIVTNANKRSFTLTSTGGGGWTGNPNQFTTSGGQTNIKSGALVTNLLVDTLYVTNSAAGTNFAILDEGGSRLNGVGITNGNVTIPGNLDVAGTSYYGTVIAGSLVVTNGNQFVTNVVGNAIVGGVGFQGITNRLDNVGTTITPFQFLTNGTLATVGAQQASPLLAFGGHGWKTTATAASQTADMGLYNLPVQGAANPSSQLTVAKNINGAGWTTSGTYFSSLGDIVAGSAITANGSITALASSLIGSSGRWQLQSPSSGMAFFSDNLTSYNFTLLGLGGYQGTSASLLWNSTNWPALRVEASTNGVTLGVRKGTNTTEFGWLAAQYFMPSNSLATWPTAPQRSGDAFWGNSNGTIYLLQSGMGNTWIATNKIGL